MKADQPHLLMDALFRAQGLERVVMKDEPAAAPRDRNLHPRSTEHRQLPRLFRCVGGHQRSREKGSKGGGNLQLAC